MSTYPYWRLSSFYLFYYACLGAWIPFWPLYIKELGYGAVVIGITSVVFNSTRVLAPNLWGYLSDRTGKRLRIIRYGCFLGFIAILGMLFGTEVWWLTLVLFLFSFFWSAVLPQFEVLTLSYLGDGRHHLYGKIRLWGSIGFIGSVAGLGVAFDWVSIRWFPWVICATLLMLWLSSLVVPATEAEVQPDSVNGLTFKQMLQQPSVWGFLLCVMLSQVAFGPYYNFFSIYMDSLGYSKTLIGILWNIGIVAEILVFLAMRQLFERFGIRQLVLFSLAMTILRWLVVGTSAENIWVLALSQILHAFSFGTFHAAMVEQIRRIFPSHQHGKGQALFNSVGYGVGSVLGAALSGLFWDQWGAWLFIAAAGIAAVAMVAVYFTGFGTRFSVKQSVDTPS